MAISITDATDSNSNVLAGKFGSHTGDLKYKAIEITFDSSYPTGGESLTPGMVGGFDDIINIIIEPSDGISFSYDYTNEKIKAYGVAPVPITITDADGAASAGVAVYAHIDTIGTDSDRKIAHLESVTANNATVTFQGNATLTTTSIGTMWDDDAAASSGLQVYVDENGDTDLTAAKFLVDNDTTETDLYVPMSDGSYLTLYNDDSASSNGVAVYFDDNASTTSAKWLLVTPSNASVSTHTSTIVSDRAASAEVQNGANLALQTSVRAFVIGKGTLP